MPVPLVSPELPPAASFTVGRSSPCLCLADQRDPLVSRAHGRETERGPRVNVGRAARIGPCCRGRARAHLWAAANSRAGLVPVAV
jgi:hypothetical protein